MADHGEKMLELRNVTAGYGDTIVLRDATIEVPASAAVALLGPNGAGKTTLLRVASGLIRPVSGRIFLHGHDVTGQDTATLTRKGLCHIPEGRGIFPSLSVRENLRLSAPKTDEAASIERAVEAFPQLGRRLKQAAGSLSGGEQQMLAISRAYISNPQIVLVDEASMGLAPIVVDALFEFLSRIEAALLLVEQYVTRALKLADTAYLISNGTIVNSGPAADFDPQEIFATYLNIDVDVAPSPSPPESKA
jgi:branched-chain amino acid transport system ATP-binding protein